MRGILEKKPTDYKQTHGAAMLPWCTGLTLCFIDRWTDGQTDGRTSLQADATKLIISLALRPIYHRKTQHSMHNELIVKGTSAVKGKVINVV